MRWAEIVANGSLDDSQDGLNLMIKQTLQMDKKEPLEKIPEHGKAKTSSWRDALLGVQAEVGKVAAKTLETSRSTKVCYDEPSDMDTVTLPSFESSSSNGFSKRKRLGVKPPKPAVDAPPTPSIPKEKRRKKNDSDTTKLKPLGSVHSPILFVKRIKSWASEGESDSEDEDYLPGKSDEEDVEVESPAQVSRTEENTAAVANATPMQGVVPIAPLTEQRISKRQRQIDIGKSTTGYHNYLNKVKVADRTANDFRHPVTPDKEECVSKRAWDVKVRSWRRALHMYDDPSNVSAASIARARRTPRSTRKRAPKKNAALSAPPKALRKAAEFSVADFPSL